MNLLLLCALARPLGTVAIVCDTGDGVTAVDVENCPGNVTCAFGGEKDAGLNHVFRRFSATQRQAAQPFENAGTIGLARGVSARQAVDVDAVESQRMRRRPSESVDCAAVGGPRSRLPRPEHTDDRTQVDNPTRALFDHLACDRL